MYAKTNMNIFTRTCFLLLILVVFIDVCDQVTASGDFSTFEEKEAGSGSGSDERTIQSGLLTAADTDDNLNFLHYLSYKDRILQGATSNKNDSSSNNQYPLPSPILTDRISVRVSDKNGNPFSCALVQVGSEDGETTIELPAGTNGRLSVFPTLDGLPSGGPATWEISARAPEGSCPEDCSDTTLLQVEGHESTVANATAKLTIQKQSTLPNKLDLALIVDTTGSMCDELKYLQTEIKDVIQTILNTAENDNSVDVQLAIVLYKDNGESYAVRTTAFGAVDSVISTFKEEMCGGGGDHPEAMEQGLSAAKGLQWRSGNVARVAFVVADAPPHDINFRATLDAALGLRKIGVRLYGLAASGVADTAEYIMRLASLVTGGRYTWLTDDSGIGNSHAEPSVICYQVTKLDSLLVRVLQSELLGRRVEPDESHIIREVGSQAKGICVVDVDPDQEDDGKDGGDIDTAIMTRDSSGKAYDTTETMDAYTIGTRSASAESPMRMINSAYLWIVIAASIFLC